MRDFIRFLDSYKNLLIFILFQVICLSLVFRTSVFQRGVFLSSVNEVSGSLYDMREDLRGYFHLQEENDQLGQENLSLIERSRIAFEQVDKNYALIDDTLFIKRFSFQYADVINSSKSKLNNYVTLNKGTRHGIESGMGVLSELSVVGRVIRVTENYALVMPVIHSDFQLAVQFADSRYFGYLTWPGDDFRMAKLGEIPTDATIEVGDRVITRGSGSSFPAGLEVGIVDRVELDEGGNFFDVHIELAVDMSKLNRVLLIKDLHRQELDSLTTGISLDE
ncbi:MAG: rod shape-determining protein MreC [Flavobacteriales bacterium]|nr:rod shape-determining protein MreC [Flavobacteriales bacterium]